MSNFLRILVISDLHFSGEEKYSFDSKIDAETIGKFVTQSQKDKFLERLKKLCKETIEYPKAVIVAGDIVDKGGANVNEYSQAVNFLNEVAKISKIESKNIFIVPGNHDVLWQKGLGQIERFNNFIEATKSFSRPSIIDNQLSALEINLDGLVNGIKVRLLLLVSPTFSGYSSGNVEDIVRTIQNKFIGNHKENLTEEDMSVYFEAIYKLFNHKQFYDIAAIGTEQRNMISKNVKDENNDYISIAVLHHHLLPASSIEISQFESVLDSGKVLEKLVESKYDFVITGHKHNQKLVHYYLNDSNIDVFSSPSLFFNNEGESYAGFAFLDIYSSESPFYAKLTTYKTFGDLSPISTELVREGRLLKDTKNICTKISPHNQLRYLNRVTPLIAECLSWKESTEFRKEMFEFFDNSFDHSIKFFNIMAHKKIIINSPYANKSWQKFMDTVNKFLDTSKENQLLAVSYNDIDYWYEAILNKNCDSSRYSQVLKSFKGSKSRIWVLHKDKFIDSSNPDYSKVIEIMRYMRKMGFKVYKCYEEDVKFIEEKDFSIISDICISRWYDMEEGVRELVESFDVSEINAKKRDWEKLMNKSHK